MIAIASIVLGLLAALLLFATSFVAAVASLPFAALGGLAAVYGPD